MEPSSFPPSNETECPQNSFTPLPAERILEALDVLIVVIDSRGRIVDLNQAVEQKTGYARQNLIGNYVWESLLWKNLPPSPRLEAMQAALTDPLSATIFPAQITQYLAGPGDRTLIQWSIRAAFDADQHITHYIGTGFDITHQHESETVLRRQNQGLSLLTHAAQALTSSLEMDRVMASILDETCQILDVLACSIWLLNEETGQLVCEQASGPQNEQVRGWKLDPGVGIAGWVVEHGQSLIVADAQNNIYYFPNVGIHTGLDLRSILCVPLRGKHKIIGVLQVMDRTVGRFDATDMSLMESLAASASAAIENARLFAETHQRAHQMATLNRIVQQLNAALSTTDIFKVLATELTALIPCDQSWVGLLDSTHEALILHFLENQPDLNAGLRWPLDLASWGKNLLQGEISLTPELLQNADFPYDRWLYAAGHRSQLIAPLQLGERIIGALILAATRTTAYLESDRQLIHQLAGTVAAALNNALLFEETERLKTFNEQIVQNMDEGILICNDLGQITFVNPKMAEILETSPDSLIEQYWESLLPPQDLAQVRPEILVRPPLRTGYYETNLKTSRGTLLPIQVNATPLTATSAPGGVLSVITNLAPRRQAEAAVQAIFKGTAATVGRAFFESLVMELATVLQVRASFITLPISIETGDLQTITICLDRTIIPNRRYNWAGAPSEFMFKTGQPFYTDNLKAHFSWSLLSEEIDAQSFMGIPLFSAEGKPLGMLVITHDKPISDPALAHTLLSIFAARVGVELERMAAEEALQASELRYQGIIEDQLEVVVRFTLDGKLTFANRAACECFGLDPEMLAAYDYRETVPETSREFLHQQLLALTPDNPVLIGENVNIDARGDHRWMRWSNRAIFNDRGEIVEIQSLALDISDRKQMEEALRESEEQYRLMFETMLNGFSLHEMIFDENGRPSDYRFLAINPAFEKFTGISPDRAIGHLMSEIIPDLDPIFLENYGRVAITGMPFHFEAYVPQLGRHYEINAYRPKPGHFATIFSDVTQRVKMFEALQASEEQLSQIVETTPAGIIKFDIHGRIIFANSAAETILELQRNDLLGQTYYDGQWEITTLNGEPFPESRMPFVQVLQTGIPVHNIEFCVQRSQGHPIFLSVNAAPLKDAEGKLTGVLAVLSDITETRRTVETLHISEEKFRRIVETAREGIWTLDKTGRTNFVNHQVIELLGYQPEEILGRPFFHFVPEEDRPDFAHDPQHAPRIASGKFEQRLLRADGSEIWGWVSSTGIRDEQGHFNGMIAMITDMTEYRQALENVRQSEQKFRTLFDSVADALYIFDSRGHFLEVNQVACEQLGYTHEEMLKLSLFDINDPQAQTNTTNRLNRVLSQGRIFAETVHIRRDGTRIPVEINSRTLLYENQLAIFSSARNITERKLAEAAMQEQEAQYRIVIQTALDGFVALSTQGRILDLNDSFAQMTGYNRRELTGMNIHNLDNGMTLETLHRKIEKIITVGQDLFETRLKCKDGHEIDVEVSAHYMKTQSQGLLFCFVRNISERKRNQEILLRTERLAGMGRMAAALAHEINNPLQSIGSSMELVLDFPLPETEKAEYLHNVRTEIDRLKTLTHRILDFARPPRLERHMVQVTDILQTTLAFAGKQLQHSRIQISTDLAADLPQISGASASLSQVFLNLILNAAEAMPEGGQLLISARAEEEQIRITFTDSGPGLTYDVQQQIFEPFFTTKTDGTGLGIPISHSIIQQHGGKLLAENAPSGGACFIILLPIAPPLMTLSEEDIALL